MSYHARLEEAETIARNNLVADYHMHKTRQIALLRDVCDLMIASFESESTPADAKGRIKSECRLAGAIALVDFDTPIMPGQMAVWERRDHTPQVVTVGELQPCLDARPGSCDAMNLDSAAVLWGAIRQTARLLDLRPTKAGPPNMPDYSWIKPGARYVARKRVWIVIDLRNNKVHGRNVFAKHLTEHHELNDIIQTN